jgi:hypothetical protein
MNVGWSGGSIGKEGREGITEPITAVFKPNKKGLGHEDN